MKNLKKTAALLLAAAVALPLAAGAQYEPITADMNSINIVVDGERVVADNFLYNDTTYVPLRRIAEMLGKKVEWNEAENAALIIDAQDSQITDSTASELEEHLNLSMDVERNTVNIFVNGERVDADNFVYNDRTYVPLRKISEMLAKDVSWDQLTNTASIGKKEPSVFDGNVLGSINGRSYTDKLVDAYKLLFGIGSETDEESVDASVSEQILQDYVLMDLAEENSVTAGVSFENEYRAFLDEAAAAYGGEETFNAILEQNGYSSEMYHYIQMINYIYSELLEKCVEAPAEDEVQTYYNDNLDTMFVFDGLRAKHILITPEADDEGNISDENWDKALKTAEEVYKLAKDGEDFDGLIAEYNTDPGMESNPDGYTFKRGQMVSEFEDACYSMEEGDISEPVKTDYGYHIIRLEKKLPYYEFDDAVKAFIVENIRIEKFSDILTQRIDAARTTLE